MKTRLGFKAIAVLASVSFSAFAQLSSPQTVNWNGTSAILQLGDLNHYIKSVQGAGVKIGTYQYPDVINISEVNGCVGIGNANPSSKLQVTMTSDNSHTVDALASGSDCIAIYGLATGIKSSGVVGNATGSGSSAITGMNNNSTGWAGTFYGRVVCTGSMQIGTQNPIGSYKLAVEGKIGCRELVITTAAWADHVFKPDYSLKPLNEVEKFIKTNKHLEGIPSEKEAIGKGVAVGDMQVKLLQKVEELTLYTIELNKKVELLAKANEELRNNANGRN